MPVNQEEYYDNMNNLCKDCSHPESVADPYTKIKKSSVNVI